MAMEGDSDNEVIKKILMTRVEAGRILGIDASASAHEINRAYRHLALKIYPKELINSEQTIEQFEKISVAYKRLVSNANEGGDNVEITGEYPFKLFRKVFEPERHVVRVYTEHGSFIVLGRRYTTRRHSNNSEDDDFDASQYSFQQEGQNGGEATERIVAKTKAEKKRLKRQKQRENKRQAKENLQKEREEIKLERQKFNINGTKDVQQHESGCKEVVEVDKSTEPNNIQKSRYVKPPNETLTTRSKSQESKKLVSQYKHKYASIQATEKTKSIKLSTPELDSEDSFPDADENERSAEESDTTGIDVDCAFFAKSIKNVKMKKSIKNLAKSHSINPPVTTEPLEQSIKKLQDKIENRNNKNTPSVQDDVNKLTAEGNALVAKDRFEEAIVLFSRVIVLDPKNSSVYFNRSCCYEMVCDFEKALLDAEKVISIAPDWSKGYFKKGRVLTALQKYMEAERTYELILKLCKDDRDATAELFNVRVKRLEEMGFSKQKSILAIRKYNTVDDAVKKVLSGALAENAEDDVYVSDDEDIVVPVEQVAAMAIAKTMNHLENTSKDASSTRNLLQAFPCQQNGDYIRQRNKETTHIGGSAVQMNSFEPAGLKREENWTMYQGQQTISKSASDIDSEQFRNPPYYALWIGNVTRKITESHLHEYFKTFGPIRSIKMHPDKLYAFVNFVNSNSASLAMSAGCEVEVQGIILILSFPGQKFVPNRVNRNTQSTKFNPPNLFTKMYPRAADVPPRHAKGRIVHGTVRECCFWRKNGCYNGQNCKFLHIPEHQGIDGL